MQRLSDDIILGGGSMKKEERERPDFLRLCGDRDSKILNGTEKMTFEDFNRLQYLTDFLGFERVNMELWRRFAPCFMERFQKQMELCLESEEGLDFTEQEEEIKEQEQWVREFCRNVPDREQREWMERIAEEEGAIY